MPTCRDCGTAFDRTGARGPAPARCGPCKAVHQQVQDRGYSAVYRDRHPDQVAEAKRRPENRAKGAAYMRARRTAEPERFRDARLAAYRADPDASTKSRARAHGMTVAEYHKAWAEQDGRCAICHREETARGSNGRIRRLAIDHDHTTGEMRGLLCHACNVALGLFNDDPALLDAAAGYLRATRKRAALHVMEG